MHFSVSAAMGFISIFGIAVQDAILVVTYFQRLRDVEGHSVVLAAREAAEKRFRPVLMTTLVAMLGLLPAAVSNGIGVADPEAARDRRHRRVAHSRDPRASATTAAPRSRAPRQGEQRNDAAAGGASPTRRPVKRSVKESERDGPNSIRVCIVSVSDTRTQATDDSGRTAIELVEAAGHKVVRRVIIKDDPSYVKELVRDMSDANACDVIILSGGTGITKRDNTHEALEQIFEKRIDGFGEAFRRLSWDEFGPRAILRARRRGSSIPARVLAPGEPERGAPGLEQAGSPRRGARG